MQARGVFGFFFWGHCYMTLCKESLNKNIVINKCDLSKLQKNATEISKKKMLKVWSNTGKTMDTTEGHCTEGQEWKGKVPRRDKRTHNCRTRPKKGQDEKTKATAVNTDQVTALENYYTRFHMATFTPHGFFWKLCRQP